MFLGIVYNKKSHPVGDCIWWDKREVDAYAAILTLLPVPFAATMRIMVVMYLPFINLFLVVYNCCSVNRTHVVEKGYSFRDFFRMPVYAGSALHMADRNKPSSSCDR